MAEFEQLVYTWSESNLFGRRGFGVVAASAGWMSLLNGGDDVLGPVVAYPEPGRRGAQPPVHGGLAMLGGTPVLFRRLPSGNDAMDRPGNYTVHALIGGDAPIDTDLAAGLLTGGWLASPLPVEGPRLPVLVLARPGRRGGAGASALVCAAVLQGLRDQRRVVIAAPDEEAGRIALCDALRRLPTGLASRLAFSTLESAPDRAAFDVAVTVAGWESGGPRGTEVRVDLESGQGNADPAAIRWGEALVGATAASLRGIPEPVTATALGTRLEGLGLLRTNPRDLSPEQLLSVLTSPDGQAWAAEPAAPAVVRSVVAGMDPALGPQFAKAAARRRAVSSLLEQVGWEVVSGAAGVSTRKGAESLLLGLGAQQGDIDMAVLSAEPERALPDAESARLLRLLTQKGAPLSPAAAAKVTWSPQLAAEYPRLWFEAVVAGERYKGPRADRRIVEALSPQDVGAVLATDDDATVRRLWAVIPEAPRDQVAYLRLIGAGGAVGLGVLAERLLAQPALSPAVRREVLAEFWPILVREMRLPPYLADALVVERGLSDGAKVFAALTAMALVVALVWGLWFLR